MVRRKKKKAPSKRKATKARNNRRNAPKKARNTPKKKRDLADFPGLKKNLFSKVKQEYHDIDYIDKLSDEDKAFMSTFMEEDLGARLNHSGKKLYKKKRDKLESWRRNNQRNRDLYSLVKATGKLDSEYQEYIENNQTPNPEEAIGELIDNKHNIKILTLEEYNKLKNNMTEEIQRFYEKYYSLKPSAKKT